MTDNLILHSRTQKFLDHLMMKLPQALIIEGPSGSGTLTVARHLAKSLGSPELIIFPKKSVGGQMVVDGQEGSIIIDDIRVLYQQTRTAQPDTHVYILDTGERSMTPAAQNAFLKLLEEPRPHLHFIITTHHIDQLLPTIKSRSQQLSLLPISLQQTSALIESLGINDPTKKARLAFVGQGLPALIKRLAIDETAYTARVAIMSDAKAMITGSPYERLLVAHKYKDSRAAAITLLEDVNHQLRVVVRKNPDPKLIESIANHLDIHQAVLSGGNIRLQLAAGML